MPAWTDRLLIVAPHPDDETLGCGGLLASLLDRQEPPPPKATKPHALILSLRAGHDIKVKTGPAGDTHDELYPGSVRLAELGAAADRLGFTFAADTLPLHELDGVLQRTLIQRIEHEIRRYRPTTILGPAPGYDQDHIATHLALLAACRPHAYAGNVLLYGAVLGQLVATFFVPLTPEQLGAKMDGYAAYASQLDVPDHHPFSLASVKALAAAYGRLCGRDFAEAYGVVRWAAAPA